MSYYCRDWSLSSQWSRSSVLSHDQQSMRVLIKAQGNMVLFGAGLWRLCVCVLRGAGGGGALMWSMVVVTPALEPKERITKIWGRRQLHRHSVVSKSILLLSRQVHFLLFQYYTVRQQQFQTSCSCEGWHSLLVTELWLAARHCSLVKQGRWNVDKKNWDSSENMLVVVFLFVSYENSHPLLKQWRSFGHQWGHFLFSSRNGYFLERVA